MAAPCITLVRGSSHCMTPTTPHGCAPSSRAALCMQVGLCGSTWRRPDRNSWNTCNMSPKNETFEIAVYNHCNILPSPQNNGNFRFPRNNFVWMYVKIYYLWYKIISLYRYLNLVFNKFIWKYKYCPYFLQIRSNPWHENQRRLSFWDGGSIVPTLTSKSVEIYLSMAGAKQHNDMGFILVPAVGRTSSTGALVALYCGPLWCS
jgi:hypothetical protein